MAYLWRGKLYQHADRRSLLFSLLGSTIGSLGNAFCHYQSHRSIISAGLHPDVSVADEAIVYDYENPDDDGFIDDTFEDVGM